MKNYIDLRIEFDSEHDQVFEETFYTPSKVYLLSTNLSKETLLYLGESAFQSKRYTVDVADALFVWKGDPRKLASFVIVGDRVGEQKNMEGIATVLWFDADVTPPEQSFTPERSVKGRHFDLGAIRDRHPERGVEL